MKQLHRWNLSHSDNPYQHGQSDFQSKHSPLWHDFRGTAVATYPLLSAPPSPHAAISAFHFLVKRKFFTQESQTWSYSLSQKIPQKNWSSDRRFRISRISLSRFRVLLTFSQFARIWWSCGQKGVTILILKETENDNLNTGQRGAKQGAGSDADVGSLWAAVFSLSINHLVKGMKGFRFSQENLKSCTSISLLYKKKS